MAKDDYDIIVYRVLVYLYACLKRRILFDEAIFRATVRKDIESEEYFTKAFIKILLCFYFHMYYTISKLYGCAEKRASVRVEKG